MSSRMGGYVPKRRLSSSGTPKKVCGAGAWLSSLYNLSQFNQISMFVAVVEQSMRETQKSVISTSWA